MNIIIEVNGLSQCDFVQNGYIVRNPSVEFCGKDDADDCKVQVVAWLKGLRPVAFEDLQILYKFVEPAEQQIETLIKDLEGIGQINQIFSNGSIFISIREIPKYSSDYIFDPADFQ